MKKPRNLRRTLGVLFGLGLSLAAASTSRNAAAFTCPNHAPPCATTSNCSHYCLGREPICDLTRCCVCG
jgi:hypothetical protein